MNEPQREMLKSASTTLPEILVHGTARLLEVQALAVRTFLRLHGQYAALWGAPDWSELLNRTDERQLSEIVRTSAEHAVNAVRQTNETLDELQRALTDLCVQQTRSVGEQMRAAIAESSAIAQRSAQQLQGTSARAAEQVAQTTERISETALQGSMRGA